MTKQDWIRKLTSRKLWVAIAGFVGGLIAFIKSPSGSPEAIGGLILEFGSVVSYIFGEGFADAAGARAEQTVTYVTGTSVEDWNEPEEKPPEQVNG